MIAVPERSDPEVQDLDDGRIESPHRTSTVEIERPPTPASSIHNCTRSVWLRNGSDRFGDYLHRHNYGLSKLYKLIIQDSQKIFRDHLCVIRIKRDCEYSPSLYSINPMTGYVASAQYSVDDNSIFAKVQEAHKKWKDIVKQFLLSLGPPRAVEASKTVSALAEKICQMQRTFNSNDHLIDIA